MVALKKAYADIILNTTKEAATRIMISERKAAGFQQELLTVKDEALSMLVRLKQMMDSKVAEAKTASLSQRKRIEELEAQLHEAEDIERNLRSELKGAQIELEKMKNKSVQPLDEQIEEGTSTFHEDASQENTLNTLELPPMDSGPGPISPNTSNVLLNQRNTGENCCLVQESSTEQTEQLRDSLENYADNTDLASIIMRSKNPELYKNGCTQRIRAFERNLINGNMSNPGQKNEALIKEDGAAEGTYTEATPKDENMGLRKKNPTKPEDLLQQDIGHNKDQAVNFLRRSSRKRRSRYRTIEATSHTVHDTKSRELSSISRCKTYPCLNNSMVESREGLVEEEQKNSVSHLISVSSLNSINTDHLSECKEGTESNANYKTGSVKIAAKNPVLIDKSVLNGVAESSGVPDSGDPFHPSSMDSDSKDGKKCETTKSDDDKLLKYTFKRKRKREPLSSPDKCESPEKNVAKRRSGEKQSSDPEPQKSNLIAESSRDSRRLAQVARQLISLSEKKWWQ
ncbi:hypothetical protein BVC80_9097g230 [Macleaya cordata]|uniref:Uncharacterized protein n=1 Tax=Macleaya cordata TaxID=56857 RepID=A0A200QFC2_MACCD|nr:hypothetical protein BVC80_9097g230 [Macleaya cordata]